MSIVVPRRGWGYVFRVPATVVRVIDAQLERRGVKPVKSFGRATVTR